MKTTGPVKVVELGMTLQREVREEHRIVWSDEEEDGHRKSRERTSQTEGWWV